MVHRVVVVDGAFLGQRHLAIGRDGQGEGDRPHRVADAAFDGLAVDGEEEDILHHFVVVETAVDALASAQDELEHARAHGRFTVGAEHREFIESLVGGQHRHAEIAAQGVGLIHVGCDAVGLVDEQHRAGQGELCDWQVVLDLEVE